MTNSILAIIVGLVLVFLIFLATRSVQRDKFHRRNASGVEEFDDFAASRRAQWKENAVEQFSKLGGTIAVLLIIGGGIGLAFSWETRPRGGPITESERIEIAAQCTSGDGAACDRLCREGYVDACNRRCMSGDRAACTKLCREGYTDACSRQ